MRIIFATHNQGKINEMRALLQELDISVLSAREAGITEHVIEDGETLEQNALKKARSVARRAGDWTVADDTGLYIEALDNAPGVLSSRWAGDNVTDGELIEFTLRKMKDIDEDKSQAFFETSIALAAPDGRYWIFTGKINGKITKDPRGKPRPNLPYDQIFIPDGENKTFSEMSSEEKNSISHRGIAFRKLKDFLARNV